MSVKTIELSDKVSIEYLLGVSHSRNGIIININDVASVQVDQLVTGETIIIFKMKFGRADETLVISQNDLQMIQKLPDTSAKSLSAFEWTPIPATTPAGAEYKTVKDENLDSVVRYLGTVPTAGRKIEQLLDRSNITGVHYQTHSDTNPGPDGKVSPIYRVVVDSQALYAGHTSRTTVYLDAKVYGNMIALDGAYMSNPFMTNPTGKPQPIHKVECSVGGVKIPRLIATKYYDGASLKKLPEATFAMKCKCEKNFFCPNIMISVDMGTDFRSWIGQVGRPNKSGPSHFWLAVPMYNSILYSFRVKYSVMEDWSGDRRDKLMAWGISEDETFFYDVPTEGKAGDKQNLTIMRDMITYVEQVYQTVEDVIWASNIAQIIRSNASIPCRAPSHNYGTNRRVHEMLHKSGRDSDFVKSFVLSMELYNMCNFCYRDANPAFSLLPDLS